MTDPGTGFIDYGARMYWPEIGRFISPDDIEPDLENPARLNKYSYVRNNPYKYTDPTRHVEADRNDCGGGGGGGSMFGSSWGSPPEARGGPPPVSAAQAQLEAAAAERAAAQQAASVIG